MKHLFECRTVVLMGLFILMLCLTNLTGWSRDIIVAQDGSGEFTTIQAGIDAAASGDVIIIQSGEYTEDLAIGTLNVPPARKDNITVRAAEGAEVTVIPANTGDRLKSLEAVGADFGDQDLMGFLVNGENVVIEGIHLRQESTAINANDINSLMLVVSSNVTVRNCHFTGTGADTSGDVLGLAITPLDIMALQQGGGIATNLTVEDWTFTGFPFALVNSNFPKTLSDVFAGVPSPVVTARNCSFTENENGVEIDDGETNIINCTFSENQTGIHTSSGAGDTNIINCVISENLQHGIEIDDQNDFVTPGSPVVKVEGCRIERNGLNAGEYGILMETGTLNLSRTIFWENSDAQLFLDTEPFGPTTAVIDHCDLVETFLGGGGIIIADQTDNQINLTVTNSIIIEDAFAIVVNGDPANSNVTLRNNTIVADVSQVEGEADVQENILDVDPMYVDAANGNFYLQSGSPVLTAGIDGTFLGSLGSEDSSVDTWMVH